MNSLKSCIWTSCPSNWQGLCSKKCEYRKVEDDENNSSSESNFRDKSNNS